MFDLEKIFEQWVLTTDEDITKDTIKIGLEHSWLVHEAKKCLTMDPTGLMSAIKMREAYKSFIKDHYYTIEDLLKGAWNTKVEDFDKLRRLLFDGEVQDAYDNFIALVVKTTNLLGKNITANDLTDIPKSESIIFDSIKNFNTSYLLHNEKFNNNTPKQCTNARVLPILYRFDYLQQFVDSLKSTSEDNFLCLALIERTYERCDSEYDKKFDTFFAFGVKNNGAVYIISDRTIFHSPETYFKSRNPSREYSNKVDYSWFPYYKMTDIKNSVKKDNILMITDGSDSSNHTNYIVDAFDNEGMMFISILFTLIYKKYFVDLDNLVDTRNWFATEVKYLPSHTDCTALIPSETSLQVIEPSLSITASTWEYDDNIHTNGLWDFYIDEYPLALDTDGKIIEYIGSEDDFKKLSWWRMRKMQYEHIKNSLEESYKVKYDACQDWLKNQMNNNMTHLLNTLLMNKPVSLYDKFTVNDPKEDNPEKPTLWKKIAAHADIDTVEISHILFKHSQLNKHDITRYCRCRETKFVNTNYGAVAVYNGFRYPRVDCWFVDDSDNKPIELRLQLRSYADFIRLFGVSKEDLPKELKRHFYDRIDFCSLYGWKPYNGNCILNFEDPMNDLRDPFNSINCDVVLYVSKSKYKKICKELGIEYKSIEEDKYHD